MLTPNTTNPFERCDPSRRTTACRRRPAAPADVDDALLVISKRRESLLVLEDAMINICSTQIADIAAKLRLPTIFGLPTFAEPTAGNPIAGGFSSSTIHMAFDASRDRHCGRSIAQLLVGVDRGLACARFGRSTWRSAP